MNCKKGTQRISHEWGKLNDSNYDGNCTSTSPPVRDLVKNQRSLYVRLSVRAKRPTNDPLVYSHQRPPVYTKSHHFTILFML
jgi:hypothetical protein